MPTITGLSALGRVQLLESLADGMFKAEQFALVDPDLASRASKSLSRLAKELAELRLPGGGAAPPKKAVTEIRSAAELEATLAKARSEGRPVVLDFFAPWCKPCVRAMPRYIGLAEKYGDKAEWLKLNIDVVGDKVKTDWNVKKIPKFAVWRDGATLGECGTGYDAYFNSSLKLEAFVDHVLLGGPLPEDAVQKTSPHVTELRSAESLRSALAKAESTQGLVFLAFCHGSETPASYAKAAKECNGDITWLQVDVSAAGQQVCEEWGVSPKAAKFVAWFSGDRLAECGEGTSGPFQSEASFEKFKGFAAEQALLMAPPQEDAFGFDADF